jgi:hypothetical protein
MVADVNAVALRRLVQMPLQIVEKRIVQQLGVLGQMPVQDAVDRL